jgi:hypothetical protein
MFFHLFYRPEKQASSIYFVNSSFFFVFFPQFCGFQGLAKKFKAFLWLNFHLTNENFLNFPIFFCCQGTKVHQNNRIIGQQDSLIYIYIYENLEFRGNRNLVLLELKGRK